MYILDGIVEKENRFVKVVKEITTGEFKTYIYGDGQVGNRIKHQLEYYGIKYDGIVVNQKYWDSNKDSICLERLLDETREKINLIIAFRGFDPKSLETYRNNINVIVDMDWWAGMDIIEGQGDLTYKWVKDNAESLQGVWEDLQDELSRKTLLAYLNQKISADYKYLEEVRQSFQYFDENINKMSDHEVFVDCGAYDGDSAVDFIQALHRRGYDVYDEIISFEPDPENYEKLKARELRNHTCIQKGVGSERKTISLSQGGTNSRCSEDGELCVEVDSIDHSINGRRVTMIKMDIEGAELEALYGAKDTITKFRPLLSICMYHKRDDLLTIPQYIKSIVPEYRLFLRAYERTTTELVLYAVV